jgi:hypothetical protein
MLRQRVDRSDYADQVGPMHNAFVQVVEHRPTTRPVQVVPDIVELTVTATR